VLNPATAAIADRALIEEQLAILDFEGTGIAQLSTATAAAETCFASFQEVETQASSQADRVQGILNSGKIAGARASEGPHFYGSPAEQAISACRSLLRILAGLPLERARLDGTIPDVKLRELESTGALTFRPEIGQLANASVLRARIDEIKRHMSTQPLNIRGDLGLTDRCEFYEFSLMLALSKKCDHRGARSSTVAQWRDSDAAAFPYQLHMQLVKELDGTCRNPTEDGASMRALLLEGRIHRSLYRGGRPPMTLGQFLDAVCQEFGSKRSKREMFLKTLLHRGLGWAPEFIPCNHRLETLAAEASSGELLELQRSAEACQLRIGIRDALSLSTRSLVDSGLLWRLKELAQGPVGDTFCRQFFGRSQAECLRDFDIVDGRDEEYLARLEVSEGGLKSPTP
jgi:hypothetical protein